MDLAALLASVSVVVVPSVRSIIADAERVCAGGKFHQLEGGGGRGGEQSNKEECRK